LFSGFSPFAIIMGIPARRQIRAASSLVFIPPVPAWLVVLPHIFTISSVIPYTSGISLTSELPLGSLLYRPSISDSRINRSALIRIATMDRSEEHTSELQSRPHLVCRLLLEKKKK